MKASLVVVVVAVVAQGAVVAVVVVVVVKIKNLQSYRNKFGLWIGKFWVGGVEAMHRWYAPSIQ